MGRRKPVLVVVNVQNGVLEDACASHVGPEAHSAGLLIARRYIGTDHVIRTTSLLPV